MESVTRHLLKFSYTFYRQTFVGTFTFMCFIEYFEKIRQNWLRLQENKEHISVHNFQRIFCHLATNFANEHKAVRYNY